ncbi:MAG: AI-2E family transporter [Eubacteriaceae bacterium]
MKFKIKDEFLKKYVYLGVTLCAVLLFYKLIENISIVRINTGIIIEYFMNAIEPFVIGIIITYFLYRPVRYIDKILLKKNMFKKHVKASRLVAILIIYFMFFTFLYLFFANVIPKIGESVRILISNTPNYIEETQRSLTNVFSDDGFIGKILKQIESESSVSEISSVSNIQDILIGLLNNTQLALNNIIQLAFERALNFSNLLMNVFLSIFIALYLLLDKESINRQVSKILKLIIPKNIFNKIKRVLSLMDEIFYKFLTGKILCSIFIGFLCFIGLLILKVPHALLISLIVGVTNIIPYFGPIIGAVPGVIITLFYSPIKALWVLILVIIIQQFDGNILGPKVLGDMMGLKPFWIIFSVILGGKFFGVAGMFLAMPIFAVIKVLLSEWMATRTPDRTS